MIRNEVLEHFILGYGLEIPDEGLGLRCVAWIFWSLDGLVLGCDGNSLFGGKDERECPPMLERACHSTEREFLYTLWTTGDA